MYYFYFSADYREIRRKEEKKIPSFIFGIKNKVNY
jgi:hypothetical protein